MSQVDVGLISERCMRTECKGYERCAFSGFRAPLDDTQSAFQPKLVLGWRHEKHTNLAVLALTCSSYTL